jgi:bacterial/archaeal transporter family protein
MAFSQALKLRWFWYSILCVLCWGAWAMLSKLGSREIPPETMQFLFTIGYLPVGFAVLAARRFQLEKTVRGISFGLLNGVLSAIGGLALFAAYHTTGNTYVITVASALYPMITVILAMIILRERLNRMQVLGIACAAGAIVLFAL